MVMNPDGSGMHIYAYGIRNAGGGLAINPKTGELWCSVNERDQLGNNLVPDYITHVQEGGFYGWPYYYIGGNPDPRLKGAHPELKNKVIVPDVLLQPHNASLEMAFYQGQQFPSEYQGDIFSSQAWLVEQGRPRGIRSDSRAAASDWPCQRRVRGLSHRVRASQWRCLGTAGGRHGGLGWIAIGYRDDGSNSIWRVEL